MQIVIYMIEDGESGCWLSTRRDARIAAVWTLVSVLLMTGGGIVGWFTEDWALRSTMLLVPALLLMMIHFSGWITWRFQSQSQGLSGMAYTNAAESGSAASTTQYSQLDKDGSDE